MHIQMTSLTMVNLTSLVVHMLSRKPSAFADIEDIFRVVQALLDAIGYTFGWTSSTVVYTPSKMDSYNHDRRRQKSSEEAIRIKKEREAGKIREYNNLVEETFQKRRLQQYDKDSLVLTTRVLSQNPDFYTIWNFRREILINGYLSPATEEDKQAHLLNELRFFMEVIQINPKSYWIWNHRRWCLETMPVPAWEGELKLVSKMLEMDSRNFHGWDYRRYVISQFSRQNPSHSFATQELTFTTRKIEQNFSNFSAWHLRTKVLGEILAGMDANNRAHTLHNELELVRNAIWTMPKDQSAWLYYTWLIGRDPIPVSLLGAYLLPTDQILLAFTDSLRMLQPFDIFVLGTDSHRLNGNWKPYGKLDGVSSVHVNAFIWLFTPDKLPPNETFEILVKPEMIATSGSEIKLEKPLRRTVRRWELDEEKIEKKDILSQTDISTIFNPDDPASFHAPLPREELLQREIKVVRELLEELESDALETIEMKWALQTLAHFLEQLRLARQYANTTAVNDNNEVDDEIIRILERLHTIDTDRANRYKDWRTKVIFDRATRKLTRPFDSYGQITFTEKQPSSIDLSNLGLTYLPTPSLLLHLKRIELSGNEELNKSKLEMLWGKPIVIA